MEPGYIKLQRRFFSHWLWDEKHSFSKAEAFLDLLQLAAFVPTKRVIQGSLIELEQGELVASVRYLSARWTWGKEKVSDFLKLLESDCMIGRKTRQGQTIIILCNYRDYNGRPDSKPDSNPDTCRTPAGHLPDKVEEDKEDKELIPPNPQGGKREKSDNLPTSPYAIRISELFGRRLTTKWSDKEIRAFKAIPRESMEELDLVCRYTEAERLKGDQGRHRRDIATFLNNYTGELDRARAKPINGNGKTTSASSYGI